MNVISIKEADTNFDLYFVFLVAIIALRNLNVRAKLPDPAVLYPYFSNVSHTTESNQTMFLRHLNAKITDISFICRPEISYIQSGKSV